MNIFILSLCPCLAASMLCDKHVVKMMLETVQLLSSCHHHYGHPSPYRNTHYNHPCSIWVRKSYGNYIWLVEHGHAIGKEYQRRYGKVHCSYQELKSMKLLNIDQFPNSQLTPFALAMPEQYKSSDPVDSYRSYYLNEKYDIATWKYTDVPYWWQ